jgi:hypothetical protein
MAANDIEREVRVLEIFRQLLGAPQLGPEQNFFEAGGSSLLAARLATRLRAAGVLDVSASAIFAAPTARALTRYAAASSHSDENESIAAHVASSAAKRGARQRAAFARLRPASSPAEEAR